MKPRSAGHFYVSSSTHMKLLPTKQQWAKWSFVAKSGYIGTVSGVAGLFLAVVFYLVPPSTPATPADRVVMDDNPTKIELAQITVEQWLGDREPFVTVHLRNPSKRSALAVSSQFHEGSSDLKFSPTETSNIFQRPDLSIESGHTLKIPSAPVSEFLATFKAKCPGCYLLGIGKESHLPFSLSEEICRPKLDKGLPCQTNYTAYPIGLMKNFTTIFGGKASEMDIVFVYLSPNTATEYAVPKS
jgi:hypothetical protein